MHISRRFCVKNKVYFLLLLRVSMISCAEKLSNDSRGQVSKETLILRRWESITG